jgi:ATP-dependent RNA helicase DHX29
VPKGWTGKTPRQQLEEHLHKRRLGRAKFSRGADNSATLVLSSGGQESRFESVGEFDSHADACHAAATRALYQLAPQLQMDKVLPPPFRDWWKEWADDERRRKREEAEAVRKSKRDRSTNLVESMRNAQRAAEPVARSAPGAAQGQVEVESWEEQADAVLQQGEGDGEQQRQQRQPEPGLQPPDEREGEALRLRFEATRATPEYQRHAAVRAGLPAAQTKEQVLACIARERVVVIAGETGSGKS